MDVNGVSHVTFVYDVGWSIRLDACERRITAMKQRASIRHKRRAPSYFEYVTPPVRMTQQDSPIAMGEFQTRPTIEMVLYEFGAVSVTYRVAIEGPFDGLMTLSDHLHNNEVLLAHSRTCVQQLVDLIRPDVVRPNISAAVEDYVIYQVASAEPTLPTDELLRRYGRQIAQIMRSEFEPLSEDEISDALSCHISFSPTDLTVIDWNAAMVFDDDADDVLSVLEFANVQLLEMRHLDEQLSEAMDRAYEILAGARRRWLLAGTSRRTLAQVAEMQADNALLFEGVTNALKLIGDQYLSRVYRLALQRFHLSHWDASIVRKLDTLESIYQKMVDRESHLRMEVLEWIIIILIAVSIILPFLFSGGHLK